MNQVEYTLLLQRVLALGSACAFFAISAIIVFFSPDESDFYFWLILFLAWIFLTSILSLVSFWWVFSIKKEILSKSQVNQLVIQACVQSLSLLLMFSFYQAGILNYLNFLVIIAGLFMYRIWIGKATD